MPAIKLFCLLTYATNKERCLSVFWYIHMQHRETHFESRMKLLDLPIDLLILLPQFLHDIEDFTNASSSCRSLRAAFARTSPKPILRFAAASSRIFFRPEPHFLIAAKARQLGDWALRSPPNTKTLRRAFQDGIEALFELCIAQTGLTPQQIRYLHASRFSLINPIADMIDRCAGAQSYAMPNFWDGSVSDAANISFEPTRRLLKIIIYGELFCSSMRADLEPASQLPRFNLGMRLDFIKYCIHDWAC